MSIKLNEDDSYLYGLLLTDGSLRNNRIRLEISVRDKNICEKLFIKYPNSRITERTRNTNFKNNYTSIQWTLKDRKIIDKFKAIGFPEGKKSKIVTLPNCEFSLLDFWRGIIDGDGSLGLRKSNKKISPYISLVTQSDDLAIEFCKFIEYISCSLTNPKRNTRDNIYNLTVSAKNAYLISKNLYYDNCLCIDRKMEKSNIIKSYYLDL